MSAPDSKFSSPQDAANQGAYSDPAVVDCYAGSDARLFTSEKVILARIADEIRGRRVLDLGVGGGRTTPHLLELTTDYLGVDYSPELVAACAAKFPGVRFGQGDARALEVFGVGTFDLVFFSFNGIDHVGHAERQQIFSQIMRVLKPGGLLWFSSHNLRVRPPKPWQPAAYSWGKNPRTILRNFYEAAAGTRNYLARAASQTEEPGRAILVDSAHRFQLVLYFVDPAEQVRQLTARGFEDVRVLDHWGEERASGAAEIDRSAHVHYLARKPTA
jgi:SAM-dependent methyltransferase